MSPVATYFFVVIHLTNIHSILSILYGSQVAQYFNVETVTLSVYLSEFQ